MTITNLLKQKVTINDEIQQKMLRDKAEVIRLADAMAEAATNMQGQGYGAFINAREEFLETIRSMHEDYSQIGKYLS